MNLHATEAYKRITGTAPPKAWSERTPEERLQARELFLSAVRESSDKDDSAVEEFFRTIRTEVPAQRPEFSATEEDIA